MEVPSNKYVSFLAEAVVGIAFIGIVALIVGTDLTGPVGSAFKNALDGFFNNSAFTGVLGTK